MAWTPSLELALAEPIVTNLLAYIAANQAEALKWANGNTALDPMTIFPSAAGRITTERPPHLIVVRVVSELLTDEDNQAVAIRHRIVFELLLTDEDADVLAQNVYRYVRAVDSMIREIPNTLLLVGITGTQYAMIEVVDHDYSIGGNESKLWGRRPSFTAQITLTEGGNES